MLKRIRVKGYKSLHDVEVRLPRLVVLFGPNMAGKSNFLDALHLVSKLGTSRTLMEAFNPPYRGLPLESFTLGPEGVRGLLEQERLSFSIEVDLCLSDRVVALIHRQMGSAGHTSNGAGTDKAEKEAWAVRERDLRYRIEIEMIPKSGLLQIADEYLTALNPDGVADPRQTPFIERKGQRFVLRTEQPQGTPVYFDRLPERSILSMPHPPQHCPHTVATRCELERWSLFHLEPWECMRSANPVRETHHIGFAGEQLAAYLNTLKTLKPRQFAGIEKALHVFMPDIDGIEVEVNDIGRVELSLREVGTTIPARVISEGTLRILGLLALSGGEDPHALVGIEEPEAGIQPRSLELIAEFLKTREYLRQTQYIVTTHSPVLPGLLDDDFLFVVRRLQGQTHIDPFTAWGPLSYEGENQEMFADERDRLPFTERILRGDFDA